MASTDLLNEEQKARIWRMIQLDTMDSMSQKDVEVLCNIIHSEPMLKALALLYKNAQEVPMQFLQLNLGDDSQRAVASELQGRAKGIISTIDSLLDIITLPEEEDNGSTDTDDA